MAATCSTRLEVSFCYEHASRKSTGSDCKAAKSCEGQVPVLETAGGTAAGLGEKTPSQPVLPVDLGASKRNLFVLSFNTRRSSDCYEHAAINMDMLPIPGDAGSSAFRYFANGKKTKRQRDGAEREGKEE